MSAFYDVEFSLFRPDCRKTGCSPCDLRGKHKTRPHSLSATDIVSVHSHIRSLRGRKSHYCLGRTRRVYLSEELNISKVYKMLKKLNPQSWVSYESYRKIFRNSYNISFGYPRKDTCSTCDTFTVKLKYIENKIKAEEEASLKASLLAEQKRLLTQKSLHLRQADQFYARKGEAAKKAKKMPQTYAAFAMDYQKIYQCPTSRRVMSTREGNCLFTHSIYIFLDLMKYGSIHTMKQLLRRDQTTFVQCWPIFLKTF